MKRSTFLDLCFYVSLGAVLTAVIYKAITAPPGGRAFGGDTFALMSPVFFVMVAKRATRFGPASLILGGVGLAFSLVALWAAFSR